MFERFIPGGEERKQERAENKAFNRDANFQREALLTRGGLEDPQYDGAKEELIKWQQNIEDEELIKLRESIRNEVYDKENGQWVPKTYPKYEVTSQGEMKLTHFEIAEPIMNIYGYQHMEGLVKDFLSRNRMNSNFNEDRLLLDIRQSRKDFALTLVMNWDKTGLAFENYDFVCRKFANIITPTQYGAMNDGWRRHQRSTHKMIESSYMQREKEKSGFFGIGGNKGVV